MSLPFATRKILAAGLLLGLGSGCDRQSGRDAQPGAMASSAAVVAAPRAIDRSHRGSRLPDLVFRDAAGREIHTASLVGRPLLVNLWATWCGPCVAELPSLDALAGQAGAPRVLAISQDTGEAEPTAARVAAFLKDKGVTRLEPWLDSDGVAAGQWLASTLPMTIFYDAQGREVWRSTGGHDWTGADAARLLAEARK